MLEKIIFFYILNPFSLFKEKVIECFSSTTCVVVIKDYDHMKMMDRNAKWMKPRHVLLIFPLNLKAPFCTSTYVAFFKHTH